MTAVTRFHVRNRAAVAAVVPLVLGGFLAGALSGCRAFGGAPAGGAPAGGAPAGGGETPMSTIAQTLRTTVDVPDGMALQILEFGDLNHGYAQFVSREPIARPSSDPGTWAYRAVLFATRDGGRTWMALANPAPPGSSPQLFAVSATTVIVSSTTEDSWVSVDGGRTFRHDPHPSPPEWALVMSRFPVEVADGRVVMDYGQPTQHPVTTQPELPGELMTAVQAAGTRLVAAALDPASGTAYTSISDDSGRTWRRRDVPDPDGAGRLERVRLVTSPDRADVWLLGYQPAPAGSVGRAAHARKDLGLPAMWRLDDDRWISKGTVGRPAAEPLDTYSVAAVGGGLLAVAWPHGFALVDDAWTMATFFPRVEWVGTLIDGAVVASAPSNGTVYLGTRTGREIRWVQVTVDI